MLWCCIHNNENRDSDVESLSDLDELLVSSFKPDVSDDEKEDAGQVNTDSSGLEPRA